MADTIQSYFEARRQRVLAEFGQLGIEALVVTALSNVRYLSGFSGSNAMLVLSKAKAPVLLTDPRYTIQAATETGLKVEVVRGPLAAALPKFLKNARTIGFENTRISFATHAAVEAALKVKLVPAKDLLERLRMVKDASEIDAITRSVNLNSAALDKALKKFRPSMTEMDMAAELEYQMRKLGAEKPSFETIVAGGAHSALPHAQPRSAKIGGNQLLLIDMGACVDGYASDMTRVVFLGSPSKKLRQMYQAVLESQLAAIDTVKPGVLAGKVDRAARKVLEQAGLGKEFVHSTGHGLGLEIHESPRLGKNDKTRLEAGMAITIEPGAYIGGFGGIRIEDTVLVTERGSKVLTPTTKEWMVLE